MPAVRAICHHEHAHPAEMLESCTSLQLHQRTFSLRWQHHRHRRRHRHPRHPPQPPFQTFPYCPCRLCRAFHPSFRHRHHRQRPRCLLQILHQGCRCRHFPRNLCRGRSLWMHRHRLPSFPHRHRRRMLRHWFPSCLPSRPWRPSRLHRLRGPPEWRCGRHLAESADRFPAQGLR